MSEEKRAVKDMELVYGLTGDPVIEEGFLCPGEVLFDKDGNEFIVLNDLSVEKIKIDPEYKRREEDALAFLPRINTNILIKELRDRKNALVDAGGMPSDLDIYKL